MDRNDKPEFARIMTALSEAFDKEITPATADLYFSALQDVSIPDFKAACRTIMRQNKFFPRAAEILETIGKGARDRAEEGLLAAVAAARKHGYMERPKLPGAVMETIHHVFGGWSPFCQAELTPYLKKSFVESLEKRLKAEDVRADHRRPALHGGKGLKVVEVSKMPGIAKLYRALQDAKLSPSSRNVIFALASFTNGSGTAYPRAATIAAAAGVKRTTVFRALGQAERAGVISRVGTGRASRYFIRAIAHSPTVPEGAPSDKSTGVTADGPQRGYQKSASADVRSSTTRTSEVRQRGRQAIDASSVSVPKKSANEHKPHLEQEKRAPRRTKTNDPGFDRFWAEYPRKVGKAKALAAWRRAKPDADRAIAAVRAWSDSEQWRRDHGQFIPYPATWINRGGWDDVVPEADQPQMFSEKGRRTVKALQTWMEHTAAE